MTFTKLLEFLEINEFLELLNLVDF